MRTVTIKDYENSNKNNYGAVTIKDYENSNNKRL